MCYKYKLLANKKIHFAEDELTFVPSSGISGMFLVCRIITDVILVTAPECTPLYCGCLRQRPASSSSFCWT